LEIVGFLSNNYFYSKPCREEGRWRSDGMAIYGYSFWLTVIATVCYLINIGIISYATWDPVVKKKVRILNNILVENEFKEK